MTKPGGVVVWVVADQVKDSSESGTSFRQALFFMELGFKLFDTMIFSKPPRGAFGSAKTYWDCFEYMFVFSKGVPKTTNLIKDRKNADIRGNETSTKWNRDGTKSKYTKPGHSQHGRRTNIWFYQIGQGHTTKDRIASQHPAKFPDKLAYDHVLSWSNPGDLVFDPMTGSGTTCKAAKISGRNYIGVDISPEYIEIAKQRLDSILL